MKVQLLINSAETANVQAYGHNLLIKRMNIYTRIYSEYLRGSDL